MQYTETTESIKLLVPPVGLNIMGIPLPERGRCHVIAIELFQEGMRRFLVINGEFFSFEPLGLTLFDDNDLNTLWKKLTVYRKSIPIGYNNL